MILWFRIRSSLKKFFRPDIESWITTGESEYFFRPAKNGLRYRYTAYKQVSLYTEGRIRWKLLREREVLFKNGGTAHIQYLDMSDKKLTRLLACLQAEKKTRTAS